LRTRRVYGHVAMSAVPPSPLSVPEPWDLVADAYTEEVAPMFEAFARRALELAAVAPGQHVVDVAAGPGTLAFIAAGVGARVSALDFSPNMVEQLRARIARDGTEGLDAQVGDGMALPFADGSFDAGFSMFGLMFFPDRDRGFRELHRVLRSGARAVVSSWVAMDRLPLMGAMFTILGELMPGPPAPPRPMPLVDPHTCVEEMTAAGFVDVQVHEHVSSFDVPSIAEFVEGMVRTNAPVVLMRRRLGDAWPDIQTRLREGLEARFGPGPQRVEMPANLTVGHRP
jgi:SAM-dependent methyltransferase